MITGLQKFLSDESGVEAIEYGILAACIFLIIVGAVSAFATNATGMFFTLVAAMP